MERTSWKVVKFKIWWENVVRCGIYNLTKFVNFLIVLRPCITGVFISFAGKNLYVIWKQTLAKVNSHRQQCCRWQRLTLLFSVSTFVWDVYYYQHNSNRELSLRDSLRNLLIWSKCYCICSNAKQWNEYFRLHSKCQSCLFLLFHWARTYHCIAMD